jgi:sortase A
VPGDVDNTVHDDSPTAPDAWVGPAFTKHTRRPSRFDRPPEPHDWRWVVGGIGRVLISLGLLMFAFVAYQLWGTGIQTAATQNRLRSEFEATLASAPRPPGAPVTTLVDPSTSSPGTTTPETVDAVPATEASVPESTSEPSSAPIVTVPAPPLPERKDPVALLEIPAIDVDVVVVEGTRTADLRDGPGHFPESPLPGQLGNSAVAGHRTTHGQPFFRVNELRPGDPIIVTTLTGRYVYAVDDVVIIDADDYVSAVPTDDWTRATLTLVSCHPRYTARQRIIVRASLLPAESSPPAAAPTEVKPPDEQPGGNLPDDGLPDGSPDESSPDDGGLSDDSLPDSTVAEGGTTTTGSGGTLGATASAADGDAFSEGWFADKRAFAQVALWGVVLTAVALGAYAISRRARRNWVGALAGVIPFVIVLYFFFENVNRLLPPGL